MGVKLHPRTLMMKRAEIELEDFLLRWAGRHDLTWCEIARALTERTQRCLTLILRTERHPGDPNKKADEA